MSIDRELELHSSAVTLSDMEIFVFPELMYSLVLANIISPRIWRWRDDPWFKGIRKMTPNRKLQRIKQYIMDHYVFNLDLETWGLTERDRELARFEGIVDVSSIVQSNALFGYGGDAYYFDLDIRTHFGLDKYDSNIIPYWKTEGVEAMDAFKYREGYETGAGECVSLAALYAAAIYIVGGIPLERIYLMATPLHSQNFLDIGDGVLVNNRRLVTKAMWFNGTQISGQARRALENERVTVVSHITGWIHLLHHGPATIDRGMYENFACKLRKYLKITLTPEILGNFLRQNSRCRNCFVLRWSIRGVDRYLPLEQAFQFEQDSPYKVTDGTRTKLMELIPIETFGASYGRNKIVLNDIEEFVAKRAVDLDDEADMNALRHKIGNACIASADMVEQLRLFCHTEPRLPQCEDAIFEPEPSALRLDTDLTREEIIRQLEEARAGNRLADLAFYAARDLSRTPARPFIKAAVERNPVCVVGAQSLSQAELLELVNKWPDDSIFEERERMAQPDEVWNFQRGDGFEKALLVACVLRSRSAREVALELSAGVVALTVDGREVARFSTSKRPRERTWIIDGAME